MHNTRIAEIDQTKNNVSSGNQLGPSIEDRMYASSNKEQRGNEKVGKILQLKIPRELKLSNRDMDYRQQLSKSSKAKATWTRSGRASYEVKESLEGSLQIQRPIKEMK
ncbi:hypothetical protein Tco_0196772 [Tanacetum coccineum]